MASQLYKDSEQVFETETHPRIIDYKHWHNSLYLIMVRYAETLKRNQAKGKVPEKSSQ